MNFDRDPSSNPLNARHALLVQLAGRPGGVSNHELQVAAGIKADQASSALHCSARSGRTRSVEHPGDKDHRRRYFVRREDAEAWQAGPAPARVVYARGVPKLTAIGERIKSKARQPGPQIPRERAPQGHSWRPDAHTAGSSKQAAPAASPALPPTSVGPSPVLGQALRYYVDPAAVQGPLMAEWRALRGTA